MKSTAEVSLPILDAIDELYKSTDRTLFINSALRLAKTCFPSAVVAFHTFDSRDEQNQQHHCVDSRVDETVRTAWRKYASQSPVVRYYLAGGRDPAVATQDIVSDRTLRNTPLYAECWKPSGVTHQLGMRLWSESRVAGLSIKRDRRFTDRECNLIRAMQPHFSRAWERVAALEFLLRGDLPHRARDAAGTLLTN